MEDGKISLMKVDTTTGSSLARVTIVDEDGEVLLDELVRQTAPILSEIYALSVKLLY